MWLSVASFSVRYLVIFHHMFVHYTFSSVWVAEWPSFGKSCPLGWPCILILFCLFVFHLFPILVSRTGFFFFLIAQVLVHCLLVTFLSQLLVIANSIWAATWENRIFVYAKTNTQISFTVTAKLISAFVFATPIVQSLSFLNTKLQASGHFLRRRSLICVGPGWKPRRPVFWRRGSFWSR